mgnify:CR=1 FL=1
MRLKKIAVENIRSFLDRQELLVDGGVSIVIGPNGGGKTNLLDAVIFSLRRHLFASHYPQQVQVGDGQEPMYEFRSNDQLNNLNLERHTDGANMPQTIEIVVEVTATDLANMASMKSNADNLFKLAAKRYRNLQLSYATNWDLQPLAAGMQLTYTIKDGSLTHDGSAPAECFLSYMRNYEMDQRIREDVDQAQLSLPVLYLPVNRAAGDFQSNVVLANYNEYENKRQLDATSSRSGSQVVALAVGRLAQKYRLLLEQDKGGAGTDFREDPNIKQLTKALKELGYEWKLESVNPLANQYDIRLSKQGTSFLVKAASSGERELLTYLFAIFGLNVRDALVVVDEPELHLHPKWQKTLLSLFVELASTTGNQFLIATHSPTFISPNSIQYVSRVSSRQQRSSIERLNSDTLPKAKHLLNIINSQNNERLFFADAVVLVEGISDRIIFQKLLELRALNLTHKPIIEVIEVGGKGFFESYEKLLRSCHIPYTVIADRDYIEQIGTSTLKALFKLDAREVKSDVIDNIKSTDGVALVAAIEEALSRGDWSNARDTWEYIKSRRRVLRSDLQADEQNLLDDFIRAKAEEGIYVLRHGAIEAYLPEGYAGKDLDKIISLASSNDLWEKLPSVRRQELSDMCDKILVRSGATSPTSGPGGLGDKVASQPQLLSS